MLDHLLVHCDVTYALWCFIFGAFGIQWVLPKWVIDVLLDGKNGLGSTHWIFRTLSLMFDVDIAEGMKQIPF